MSNKIKRINMSMRLETEPIDHNDKFNIFLKKSKNSNTKRDNTQVCLTMTSFDRGIVIPPLKINKIKQETSLLRRSSKQLLSARLKNGYKNSVSRFEFSTRLPLPNEIKEIEKESCKVIVIPKGIIDKIDLEAEEKKIKKQKEKLEDELKNLIKAKNELEDLSKKVESSQNELKKAKESRNKLNEEMYRMKDELEYQKTSAGLSSYGKPYYGRNNNPLCNSVNNLSNLYNNYNTNGPSRSDNMLNMSVMDFGREDKNSQMISEIEKYEDKISKIKEENRTFLENYDDLLTQLETNKHQNKKLKNKLTELENNIQNALKEKNMLKQVLEKLNK